MGKLSIRDIAKLADTSPSTVSFVINGKAKEMRISKRLSDKIRKIIKETGYVPNSVAVSLRTGKTGVLGLIVEDISNSFFSFLAKTIEEEAYREDYGVIYGNTENNDQKGIKLLNILQPQVDGFIITPTYGMKDILSELEEQGKPMVLIDRFFPEGNIPYVLMDNADGIKKGVDFLIKKKYKKIAFVVAALEMEHMHTRLQAFGELTLELGISHPELILKLPFSLEEDAYENEMVTFFNAHPDIDCIFFATNYLSLKGLKVLQRLTWDIPARVGVISFDDHPFFELYKPRITAVGQPLADIAKKSVEIITGQIRSGVKVKESYLLKGNLIERESV